MTQKLYYPRRNIVGLSPEWRLRNLTEVKRIDLVENPLPISDFLRRPLVRRGRWLIRAWDCDSQSYRQFYECAFRNTFRELPLRIGERLMSGKISQVGREYGPTIRERRKMAIVLHRLKKINNLFVYADDLIVMREAI